MVQAISPKDVPAAKAEILPDSVIKVWNGLIAQKSNGYGSVSVQQNEAIDALIKEFPMMSRERIFNEGWLNIESIYQAAGWNVVYDKPGYNENYAATFKFTPK